MMKGGGLIMLTLVCSVLLAAPRVESRFEQVAPVRAEPARSAGQTRAVVLLHGYTIHFRAESVPVPAYRDWQRADSVLVKRLGEEGDVFVFAYGQNAALDDVVAHGGLVGHVAGLRKLGYRDIVLVGHSAGALVARQFVEDHPDAGVTKVVQVCPPNGGSSWARLPLARRNQFAFLQSLTRPSRQKWLDLRKDKRVPAGVQFVCVVGAGAGNGDGVVHRTSQWPDDLQEQGIPAVVLDVTHPFAMRGSRAIEKIAELVKADHPRWTKEQVEKARKEVLDD
jgi:pimeloyl-ACP methyl ester carboxylesterase